MRRLGRLSSYTQQSVSFVGALEHRAVLGSHDPISGPKTALCSRAFCSFSIYSILTIQ